MSRKNNTFENIFNELMKNINDIQNKIEKKELNQFQLNLYKNCMTSAIPIDDTRPHRYFPAEVPVCDYTSIGETTLKTIQEDKG